MCVSERHFGEKTECINVETGQDKAIFAANIMSDVVMDIVKINAGDIKKILDGTE